MNSCTNLSWEWQRQFQMISYKNDNFNVSENFVNFLISKLITCFINGFTSGMKSQSIVYLPIGSVHIYWISNLKGEVHQYGICGQSAFKNAKAIFFSKLSRAGNMFRSGSKNSMKGYPIQIWHLKSLWGVFNVRSC